MDNIGNIIDKIYRMIDFDPAKAVQYARSIKPEEHISQSEVDRIQGIVFIDAGADLKNADIINEGIKIMRGLFKEKPERLDIAYNLANGLSALVQATRSDGESWYLKTSDYRRESKLLFESIGKAKTDFGLIGRAKTNQANLLNQSFRWLEAYELYREAVCLDSYNAIASSGAAKALLQAANKGLGPIQVLHNLAERYIQKTLEHQDQLSNYVGYRASIKILKELPEELEKDADWTPDLSNTDAYTKFVGENHLALSFTIEGLNLELRHWDSLMIQSISERVNEAQGVPPIFAMFNTLKADYLAARWLLYQAISNITPESGSYSDTLDYACYGIRSSFLSLSQRSAIDILDRIAVAASEYLGLEGSPNTITFCNRWHIQNGRSFKKPLQWQPAIKTEIKNGNTALIALAEIAEDIVSGGFLSPQKTLRNASTHRFVVMHDFGLERRESKYIEHFDEHEFKRQTINALRLVRAALIYFVEVVALRERRLKEDSGITVTLDVPQHHWIRGEEF
jgi:hypothetical protein